jgi:predicted nucleotidyltransferase
MTVLPSEEADALKQVQGICARLHVDVVVIGAVAYRTWIQDEQRVTEDVDLVVGLDLPDLGRLTDPLLARGWRQDQRREHRWLSPKGARIDLLPAGERARHDRRLDWPVAETRMSLVGFDHIFTDAVERELASGLKVKVVPLVVLTLLKIVSYLDQPTSRQKDLHDLAAIMHVYEDDGERRFSDEVLDAGVEYSEAGAYLLGRDLSRLCADDDERAIVNRFVEVIRDPAVGVSDWPLSEGPHSARERFAGESRAFARGWAGVGAPGPR